VQFLAPLDKRVGDLLGLRISSAHNVIDIRQDGMRSAVVLQMTEIYGPIAKQHCLKGRAEMDRASANGVIDMNTEGYKHQKAHQNPHDSD
jgi:hypothetical protein